MLYFADGDASREYTYFGSSGGDGISLYTRFGTANPTPESGTYALLAALLLAGTAFMCRRKTACKAALDG